MGQKGDKATSNAALAAEKIVHQLSSIGAISNKRMFGGHGLFHNEKMFGIVDSAGNYYLKANDSIKEDFEQYEVAQHGKMPYYEIPDHVLENDKLLLEWAKKCIHATK